MRAELESRVFSLLAESREMWVKYGKELTPQFFSEPGKIVFSVFHHMYTDLSQERIDPVTLLPFIQTEYPGSYSRYGAQLKELIDGIQPLSVSDGAVITELLVSLMKRHHIEELSKIVTASLLTDNNHVETMKKICDDIVALKDYTGISSYDYFDREKRKKALTLVPIPTGIRALDEKIGGLYPGEFGFFIGLPGEGKSTLLVNFGVRALLNGKKVYHALLEESADRVASYYDVCGAGSEQDDDVNQFYADIKEAHGELILRDFGGIRCSVSTLEKDVLDVKPDLVLIDYADLCEPSQHYDERRWEYADIYLDCKRLARRCSVPVWTASQASFTAAAKEWVSLEDISEDKSGKSRVADVVCGLRYKESDQTLNVYVAKNRKGSPGHKITLRTQFHVRRVLSYAHS